MSDKDVIHRVSEFADLPWDKLDPDRCTRDWSFGRGGYGLPEGTWTIRVFCNFDDVSLAQDVWVLPPSLAAILDLVGKTSEERGRDNVRDAITTALGL
jgi:hypothetical protein